MYLSPPMYIFFCITAVSSPCCSPDTSVIPIINGPQRGNRNIAASDVNHPEPQA